MRIIFMSFVLILTGPMIARTDLWVERTAKIDTQVLMYSSTGNERFKIKAEGIVPELAKIQQALASGGFHAVICPRFPLTELDARQRLAYAVPKRLTQGKERITVKFKPILMRSGACSISGSCGSIQRNNESQPSICALPVDRISQSHLLCSTADKLAGPHT